MALILVIGLYHPLLALITEMALIVAGFFVPLIAFKTGRRQEEFLVEHSAAMRAQLTEDLQGLGELIIYDACRNHEKSFEGLAHKTALAQNRLSVLSAMSGSAVTLLSGLALAGVLLAGVPLVRQDQVALPDLALLALLVLAGFEAVTVMPGAFQGLGGVIRAARRIFTLADQRPAITAPDNPIPIPAGFSLSFESISFSYGEGRENALEDVSFTLRTGQRLALTGPTGSGKSSVVNLLMRFWEPQDGHILLGGHDLVAFAPEDVRAQFAVVPQTPYLFAATIRQNLRMAAPEASQDEIEEACRKAGLDDFIAGLPEGYDTFVGENGRQLSGGQIRRLALARALLKKAPCLILDEPGEGLDYEMEKDILRRVTDNLGDAA